MSHLTAPSEAAQLARRIQGGGFAVVDDISASSRTGAGVGWLDIAFSRPMTNWLERSHAELAFLGGMQAVVVALLRIGQAAADEAGAVDVVDDDEFNLTNTTGLP